MKKVKKGALVYIPANVRLIQESNKSVTSYFITEKPVHCLVVDVEKKEPTKKLKVIYKGVTWTVGVRDVYEVDKRESENVSYIS